MKIYLHKLKYCLIFVILTGFAAALIIKPEKYIAACYNGLCLWAVSVLPSLFPFMVICGLFINLNLQSKIVKRSGKTARITILPACAPVCILLSLISGYPTGSRTVYEFYSGGIMDKTGSRALAPLCSTCSPLFAIGTVGVNMFGAKQCGYKLFLAHIAAVFITGIFCALLSRKKHIAAFNADRAPLSTPEKKENALKESFFGAACASLTAGAFIVFFYTAAYILQDLHVLYPFERLLCLFVNGDIAAAVCTGLVEMTGGCAALAKNGGTLSLPFAGFLLTFGGVCVLLQQLCYLLGTGVKPLTFILQKLLQGAICFIILLLI